MKLKLTAVSLSIVTVLLSNSIYAQSKYRKRKKSVTSSKSVKRVKRKRKKVVENKSIELSVAGQRDNMKERDGDTIEGVGLNTSLGKIFYLGENFTTTSLLTGNLLSLEIDDSSNTSYISYNIGIGQRVGYRIRAGGMIIKPFFEAEVLSGRLYDSFTETYNGNRTEASISMNYLQYGGSVGTQFILGNGIIPFIKYKVAKTVFSDSATIKASENGGSEQSKKVSFNSTRDERTVDNSTFIVGLSFLF